MLHPLAFIQYPDLNPIIFRIGPLAVRWYGVAYLTGFALAYLWLRSMIRRGILRITRDQLLDLIGWLIAGVMIGGRTGWWLFYHRPGLLPGPGEPWYEPIAVWHGGMSFHGGLMGVGIALGVWSWLFEAPGWNIADCAALVTPIGLCLGRIANFINHELVGTPSNLPWAVLFPGYSQPRHPSQIYEAILEGPILLAILWLCRRLFHPREGRIAALFLIWYGILRFLVEFTRQPDAQLGYLHFGWLTRGQELSVLLLLVGVAIWIYLGYRPAPAPVAVVSAPAASPSPKPAKKQTQRSKR
ncbi:MAG TPA: prolipoprotein diacylglyceryl transferase [Tepidisphaeraceae bacterium]|nr:prolipoprotein diacylglyceryl transferase [Tepidisphaeraceae bacterium]